jgi:DNA-binding NtrC family response regulator
MRRLLVVSFGDKWTASLATMLSAAGWSVTPIDRASLSTVTAMPDDGTPLVLAGELDAEAMPSIMRTLEQRRGPSIIVAQPHALRRNQALATVAQTIGWPVGFEDLKERLERLAEITRPVAPRSGAADTLARMMQQARLVGTSPRFTRSLASMPRIAQCSASVLVSGETGTGKDVVARAVHYLGTRRAGPFVPVNCAALPEGLFENELFGHTNGAFTTAATSQTGLVAQATGGTLFLDEIDTLPHRSQAALLRFLQDGQYRPLGSGAPRASDVRVIAATNTDLEAMVAAGAFREDLFYRLNVLNIALPPLRERRDDIAILAEHLLQRVAETYREKPKRLPAVTLAWLKMQPWPGNVRELENWLHRRHLLSESAAIEIEDNVTEIAPVEAQEVAGGFHRAKRRAIARFERQFLSALIARSAGNVAAASRDAGTERRTLGRLLRKHGIDPADYRR